MRCDTAQFGKQIPAFRRNCLMICDTAQFGRQISAFRRDCIMRRVTVQLGRQIPAFRRDCIMRRVTAQLGRQTLAFRRNCLMKRVTAQLGRQTPAFRRYVPPFSQQKNEVSEVSPKLTDLRPIYFTSAVNFGFRFVRFHIPEFNSLYIFRWDMIEVGTRILKAGQVFLYHVSVLNCRLILK